MIYQLKLYHHFNHREITCTECVEGVEASSNQLASEEFVTGIVEALSGDGFCGVSEDPERCAEAIAVLIPLALPALKARFDAPLETMICNLAMPDICPTI